MEKLKLAKVEDEYKKFPEIKKEVVKELQEWMKNDPNLPEITELEMIIFLHSNCCNIEVTKSTIQVYFSSRIKYQEFFANRDITAKDMQKTMKIL